MTMRALEAAEALRDDRVDVGGAARADDQAARRGDDPARGVAQRPAGRRGREPHGDRRPRRGGGGPADAQRRVPRAASARSACPTSSSTPARCRRCTTATASRLPRWRGASAAWLHEPHRLRRPRRHGPADGDATWSTAGFPVRGYDLRPEAPAALAAAGGTSAETPARAALRRRRAAADGGQRRPGRGRAVRRRRPRRPRAGRHRRPDGDLPAGGGGTLAERVAGNRPPLRRCAGLGRASSGARPPRSTIMAAAPAETFGAP